MVNCQNSMSRALDPAADIWYLRAVAGSPGGVLLRWMLIADTGPVTERVRVREIDDEEGRRLVRIVRRGSGSGGDLAAGADGAAVGPGHGRGRDREGGVYQRGPGA